MKNSLTRIINSAMDKNVGLRIQPSSERRLASARKQTLDRFRVPLVYDVGANKGQWAKSLRMQGYKGDIISFEPSDSFEILKKASFDDQNWRCENVALANINGEASLFTASNHNLSTSILEPLEVLNLGLGIKFTLGKRALVTTLDSYREGSESSNFYLKLDVQGAEMLALEGAKNSLRDCVAVEFESALMCLYRGESTHYKIANFLIDHNFFPKQIVITHWDSDLSTVSMDSIFIKANEN